MDRTQLQTKIANVKPGQKLKLGFSEDAKHSGLTYLFGMDGKIITIDPYDSLALKAVARYKEWNQARNKTACVTVLDGFDQKWFVDRMYRELDSLEVLNQAFSPTERVS